MANEQNLKPFPKGRSSEEARIAGRKGGIASGAARRAKREARETAKMVLSFHPELPEQMLETMRKMGMKKNVSPDMRYIATLAIMQKAMKGDMGCYKFLVEMAGETAEASMLNAKADEMAMRSAYADEETSVPIDSDNVRQKMSEMTDEELEQYQRLCERFYDESEGDDS